MDLAIRFPTQGQIHLESRFLFSEPGHTNCRQFLERVFQAPEIDKVTIRNHAASSEIPRAELGFCPGTYTLRQVIERVTGSLNHGKVSSAGAHQPNGKSLNGSAAHNGHLGRNGHSDPNAQVKNAHAQSDSPHRAVDHSGVTVTSVTPVRDTNGEIRYFRHIAIISGDHELPTRKLAESLGMDRYIAQVLPAEKADCVAKLQAEGRKVGFVGDGINDSIALKQATVSISLRGASSIATDTAHIVFLEEGLSKLCDLRDIARELDRKVRRSWRLILAPNISCIAGVFTLGLGIMASVVTNNVAALAALACGMLPLRKIVESEAQK